MKNIDEEFFCAQCSLKFGTSVVYGLHLKLVHGKKNKSQEPERKKSFESDIQETNVAKSDSSKPIASVNRRKKSFKCEICNYKNSDKTNLKKHIASFHDGEKPFKCEVCNYTFTEKFSLKRHVASIHEGKKG